MQTIYLFHTKTPILYLEWIFENLKIRSFFCGSVYKHCPRFFRGHSR